MTFLGPDEAAAAASEMRLAAERSAGKEDNEMSGVVPGGGRTDRPSGCKELTGETQLAVGVKSVRRCGKIPGLGFFVLLQVTRQPPSQFGYLLPSAANILQISLSLSHPFPLLPFISPIPFFPPIYFPLLCLSGRACCNIPPRRT